MNFQRYFIDTLRMIRSLLDLLFKDNLLVNAIFMVTGAIFIISVLVDISNNQVDHRTVINLVLAEGAASALYFEKIISILRKKEWTLSIYPKEMKIYKAPAPKETKPNINDPKKSRA